jgi:hypothetical protein
MAIAVRKGRGGSLAVLGLLVACWLGLSGLLIVAGSKPEALLAKTFGSISRNDAFHDLDGVSIALWWAHSCLVSIALAAIGAGRTDVLTVLMIGPVIAALISLPGQKWSDPNWFVAVSECVICWLLAVVVSGLYWAFYPRRVESRLRVG